VMRRICTGRDVYIHTPLPVRCVAYAYRAYCSVTGRSVRTGHIVYYLYELCSARYAVYRHPSLYDTDTLCAHRAESAEIIPVQQPVCFTQVPCTPYHPPNVAGVMQCAGGAAPRRCYDGFKGGTRTLTAAQHTVLARCGALAQQLAHCGTGCFGATPF
jgi:hypothetical protein